MKGPERRRVESDIFFARWSHRCCFLIFFRIIVYVFRGTCASVCMRVRLRVSVRA